MAVARFGVSIDEKLLRQLDEYVAENSFTNRSQAIRKIVEKTLVEKKWQCNNLVAGVIVLVYSNRNAEIAEKIRQILAENSSLVLSSQIQYFDNGQCMEIISIRGEAKQLTHLSDILIAIKGIQHGKLAMSRLD